MSSNRENRLYYIGIGRCPVCSGMRPLRPGKHTCWECALKISERQHDRRAWRRENGLCTRCGKPLPDESKYVLCDDCRTYVSSFNSLNKRRYEALKEEGKCVRCGGDWAEPGKTMCRKCNEKCNETMRKARLDEEYREKRRQNRRDKIEAGLCIDCGRPADEGHTRCPRCRAMRRDSSRKYKIERRLRKEAEDARRRTAK